MTCRSTAKTVDVVDKVTASAVYDTDKGELTVNAASSDTLQKPTLTAKGFGDLTNGVLVASVKGTPADVTVTSGAHGSITVPVSLTGGTLAAIPVQAFAGPNQEVLSGKKVTLDGTGSTGPVKSYAWKQTSGPTVDLTGADTAIAELHRAGGRPRRDARLRADRHRRRRPVHEHGRACTW